MNEPSRYVPGMCNINPAEIKSRRQSGYFSLAVAATGLGIFVYLHAPWPYFLALFVPIFVGILGLLQARSKFCVAYAAAGKQHADDSEEIEAIDDSDAKKADSLKARTIYLKSFVLALPVTAVLCLLPLLYS